ncbi:MAG: hypothetical protein ACREAC_15435, partial [Blastocatellia bacterium]
RVTGWRIDIGAVDPFAPAILAHTDAARILAQILCAPARFILYIICKLVAVIAVTIPLLFDVCRHVHLGVWERSREKRVLVCLNSGHFGRVYT